MSREVVLRPQARQDLIDLAYFFAETDLDFGAMREILQRYNFGHPNLSF